MAAVAEAARANAQLKELEQSLSVYKSVIADNELGINLSEAPMPDQDVPKVVSLRRRPRPVRTQAPRRSKRTTATTLAFRPRRQFKKRR